MPGPLDGIRVIDLTTVVSGPVCAMLLADQGADVIKVEPPGGDIARRTAGDGQFTAMFVSCNRGKRSIALDLKQPDALEAVRRLIAGADVLVQNFRPGTMERLGLGEPAMRALNPGLVYVSISGVGETGPYLKKRVYDPVIQSLSGLTDVQADQDTGRPRMIRTIVADKTTAVHAAQAVCAALVARGRTGLGQHVRLSMLDAMIAFIWPEAMTQYTVVGRENAPQPAPRPDLIFKTLDGYITVGSLSDAEWRGLCGVINRPDWIDDPRFRTPAARATNAAERLTLVGEILAEGHAQDWLDRLDAAEVPCAPVLRRADVMHNAQVVNNQLIELMEQPGMGTVRQPRPAARFDRTPARIGGPAPRIGEHTEAILAEVGYSAAEIRGLTESSRGPDGETLTAGETSMPDGERILWGAGTSRTIRAHWAMHELGLDYERRPIQPRTGETQTPAFTALSARQKIPLLQDNGLVITESAAIVAYLSDAYGQDHNRLIPSDTRERARCLEWCFFVISELDATSLYVMRRHGDLRHIYGEAPQANEAASAYFQKQMRTVERALLDGRAYVLGDRFSAADMLLSTCVSWAVRYRVPVAAGVLAYNEGIVAREAYRRALASNQPPGAAGG